MATNTTPLVEALEEVLQIVEEAHYKCDVSTDECYDGMAPDEHGTIRRAHEAIEHSRSTPPRNR